jgi:uncharacterized protein (DUF169 family)
MTVLEKFGNAINQYIRPQTYPVAIKLVTKDELVFSVPFHLFNEISDGLKFFL